MLPIGAFAPVPAASRALLIASVLLVLIVELLNSSVEAAIDRISLERHELSKRAKDLGSAAVTVALFACVTTWASCSAPSSHAGSASRRLPCGYLAHRPRALLSRGAASTKCPMAKPRFIIVR